MEMEITVHNQSKIREFIEKRPEKPEITDSLYKGLR
tara:strand:+ start:629 stop:736 length:108 start_codon:yes stop_codon:yes gene_type:complete